MMFRLFKAFKACYWICLSIPAAEYLAAQQDLAHCRVDFTLQNQSRKVFGSGSNAIQTECPGGIHSYPFGNWGVESPWGPKFDGDQFQGWCHNTWIGGSQYCKDGWYEWNSCTDYYDGTFDTRPPNCSWYNAVSCTQQATVTGVDTQANNYEDEEVHCPEDTNDDGICDDHGCKSCNGLVLTGIWMKPYELDPVCCDSLVTTLNYSNITTTAPCTPGSCGQAFSSWNSSISNPKVSAQLRVWIRGATFHDTYGWCSEYAQLNPPIYGCLY